MGYTKSEIEKIGNTLIYFHEKVGGNLSKTKAIKLLYFLEEYSIKKFGRPFLGLEWEVWHLGPVSEDIYAEINEPFMLIDHIKQYHSGDFDGCFISPVHEFVDDEFSNAEIELMDILIANIGHLNASELIEKTHLPHTLWYKIAKENNLIESFKNKSKTTSDFKINLPDLLSEDKQGLYDLYLESKEINRSYGM